jgi:tRNA G37 N-methylase Trm5
MIVETEALTILLQFIKAFYHYLLLIIHDEHGCLYLNNVSLVIFSSGHSITQFINLTISVSEELCVA